MYVPRGLWVDGRKQARGGILDGSSHTVRPIPLKGAIALGSDAHIAVFDPDAEAVITAQSHHMNVDYNPYEGIGVKGVPRL